MSSQYSCSNPSKPTINVYRCDVKKNDLMDAFNGEKINCLDRLSSDKNYIVKIKNYI